jgi:aldehyde:ferredoxin oxidoreductase
MGNNMLNGYNGKILDIDLTAGSARTRPLDPENVVKYLGGRGLATRIFVDTVNPACEPLGPENVIVIAVAHLLGTNAPTSCRGHMVFKSPLTGLLGSSNCGGSWAPAFKATGHDVLVIRGRSQKPVTVDITEKGVTIAPAGDLWGCDVHETTDRLLSGAEKSMRTRVLCIGPAGEKLVRFASVMNDKNRAYGRSGPGAVFGSKNLKAVRVSGKLKTDVHDKDKYKSGLDQARYLMKAAPGTKNLFRELGTAGLIRLIDVIDMLPHRNFQDNLHDEDKLLSISGETIRDTILEKSGACHMCPIACQRHTIVGGKKGEGPEYETLVLLGPACNVYNLDAITKANYLCNELGMDTMSFGGTIACAMELFEKGCLTPADTGGVELRFGNHAILEELAGLIGRREGIGDRLAEGALRLAEGCGHPEIAMTVKGLEIPAYDPRASYTQALGYMTSPTGACHLRGGYAVSLAFFGGAKEIPRFSMLQSPIAIRNMQNHGILQDSLGICRFTGFAFASDPWARMVSGTTGMDFSSSRLEEISDRIATLERLFNIDAGATAEDDTLPERFQRSPIRIGDKERSVPAKTIEKMRHDYYRVQGWDEEGRPPAALLTELGIERQEQ